MFSIPEPWRGDKNIGELDKKYIQPQTIGESVYHMLQHHLSLHKFYVGQAF